MRSTRTSTVSRHPFVRACLSAGLAFFAAPALAQQDLSVEQEECIVFVWPCFSPNIAPAQQGMVFTDNGYVSSKGLNDLLESRESGSRELGCIQFFADPKLYRFDEIWDQETEQEISYPGIEDILHIGDLAYRNQQVWAPASNWDPIDKHANVLHIVYFNRDSLDWIDGWDASSLADPEFGDLAGLAWHNGLLYAIEWRPSERGPAHLFVLDHQGDDLVHLQTYELSSSDANGLAFWGDYFYVSVDVPGICDDEGRIHRYSLASLDTSGVNDPHYSYDYPIEPGWAHPHSEGLTFNNAAPQTELWVGATEYAVRLTTPDDDTEPNESSGQAHDYGNLPPNTSIVRQHLIMADSQDWYRFTAISPPPPGSSIQIAFDHSLGNLDLCVYRSDSSEVGCSEGTGNSEEVSLAGENAGTFFVKVYGDNGVYSPDYTVVISLFDAGQAPNQATNPSPPHGASNVSINSNVSWLNGGGATSYDVYFGTDPTPDAGEFQGNQIPTSFDPGTLGYGTDYYWRIDAVNDYGTTTGDVWHFTTQGGGGGDGYVFNRSTTCQDVMDDYPWDPIYEIDAFGHDDPYVYVWVQIDDIDVPIRFRFDWYTPDDEYFGGCESGWTPDPPYSWWKQWCYFPIEGTTMADMEGNWHVRIFVDNGSGWNQVSTETFTLRYELTGHTMCRDVQENDPWDPIDPTSVFYQDDEKAVAWFELSKVSNELDVLWRYLEPNGSEYAAPTYTIEDPNNFGWDFYTTFRTWAWIWVDGYSAATKCGDWTVEFFIKDVWGNWDLEYVESFQLLEAPNVDPTVVVTTLLDSLCESDALVLDIEANDNTYLDEVRLFWFDGEWNDLVLASDINEPKYNNPSYNLGTFTAGQEIQFYCQAVDTSGNEAVSAIDSVVIGSPIDPVILAWYSAGDHGDVGEALLEIPDDGTFSEPRVQGIHRLIVSMSDPIEPSSWAPEDVAISGIDTDGNPVDLGSIDVVTSLRDDGFTAVIEFTPALPDVARYCVTLDGIEGPCGGVLAGDNDRSFMALGGDAYGDGTVTNADLAFVRVRRGIDPIDPTAEDEVRADIFADGAVTNADVAAARVRRGNDASEIADPCGMALAGRQSRFAPRWPQIAPGVRHETYATDHRPDRGVDAAAPPQFMILQRADVLGGASGGAVAGSPHQGPVDPVFPREVDSVGRLSFLVGKGGRISGAGVATGEPARRVLPPLIRRVIGDVSRDGVVDANDLVELMTRFGSGNARYDVNGDGVVDTVDLLEVLKRMQD